LKLEHRVERAEDGDRLDAVLGRFLPRAVGQSLSKSTLRRFIVGGAVSVGGRPLRRAGMPVREGLRLEVRLRPDALRPRLAGDRPVTIDAGHVLFEDDVLLAVDKPPGLPTQPTVDPARPSLYGLVKTFLERRSGAPPGSAYLGLHQRLDRDTSGVVLFTKAAGVNAAVAALFSGRKVEKAYHALTARPARLPPRTWSVEGSLGGVAARTEFRLLEALPHGLLVEARPVTGRKHQVRVHLAQGGMPILGDALHGQRASSPLAPRLMLHAARLRLRHPLTGLELAIESPRPADFAEALEALRAVRGKPRA